MRTAGFGRIIGIDGRAAPGKPESTLHGATRAGLAGTTRTAALEPALHGIIVTCAAPGPVETEPFAANTPPTSGRRRRFPVTITVGRLGGTDDVAETRAHFLDERAGIVTDHILTLCGGLTVGTLAA